MAGQVSVNMMLNANLLAQIIDCGFVLEINLDLTHSRFVRTVRAHQPNTHILPKAIELDAAIVGSADRAALGIAIGRLQAARSSSVLFQFYQALHRTVGVHPNQRSESLATLFLGRLKIEFPNFDNSIVNLANPPVSISGALRACNAPSAAAFNLLPIADKSAMGMFLRTDANIFERVGEPDPQPRVAI